MTNTSQQPHPAVQWLKDNIVVIGLVAIVAASLAVFAFTQSRPEAAPAAEVKPAPMATASLDGSSPAATGATGASAEPSGTSGAPTAAAGAQGAAQPAPSATASSTSNVASANSKALTAKDWKTYAEAFSKAWLDTSGGKDAWLARLNPMVSQDLYAGFTRTNISTIPAATFESVSLAEESRASKTFRAYAPNGPLLEGRLSIQVDGGWIIDQVGPPAK